MEDNKSAPKAGCRSCVGLLYYSQSLQAAGKTPKCLGVRQHKAVEGELDISRDLSSNVTDFQYYCMGYSIYDSAEQGAGSGSTPGRLPYCEGVEVAILSEPEVLSEDTPTTRAQGESSDTEEVKDNSLSQRFVTTFNQNAERVRAAFSEDAFKSKDGAKDLHSRLLASAERNVTKLSTAIGTVGDTLYNAMVKPVWEKLVKDNDRW